MRLPFLNYCIQNMFPFAIPSNCFTAAITELWLCKAVAGDQDQPCIPKLNPAQAVLGNGGRRWPFITSCKWFVWRAGTKLQQCQGRCSDLCQVLDIGHTYIFWGIYGLHVTCTGFSRCFLHCCRRTHKFLDVLMHPCYCSPNFCLQIASISAISMSDISSTATNASSFIGPALAA